jgi:ABC-type nitrate/sulfonate/bicarbonate transport system permease component
VVIALITDSHIWAAHLLSTLALAGSGLAIACLLAIVIGLAMNQIPILERFLRAWLVISQTIPAFFLYPLLLIILGFGFLPLLVVVVIAVFFPLLVPFYQGLCATEPGLTELFRSLGASRWHTIRLLSFPSALPSFFAGLRLVATYLFGVTAMGEYLGAQSGIGVYLARAYKSYAPAKVLAAITIVSILSLLAYQGVITLQNRLIKGNPS